MHPGVMKGVQEHSSVQWEENYVSVKCAHKNYLEESQQNYFVIRYRDKRPYETHILPSY